MVMLNISNEIDRKIKSGKRDSGNIEIVIIDETKVGPNTVEITGSGTIVVSDLDIAYRDTVRDILSSYPSLRDSGLLVPLTWKYTDTEQLYNSLLNQIIEKYVEGLTSLPSDILVTDINGLIPSGSFKTPKEQGERGLRYLHTDTLAWKLYSSVTEKKLGPKSYHLVVLKEYLQTLLYELYNYRMAMNPIIKSKFSFLQDLNENVIFFGARRGNDDIECNSLWIISSFISSGEYGSVFRSCCEKKCDYAVKVATAGGKNNMMRYSASKEISIWKRAYKLGLSVKFIESYYHFASNPVDDYYIVVMETMDVTAKDALELADRENNTRLREIIFEKIGYMIKILHSNDIVHGDAHLGNVMLKSKDKSVYAASESLYNALRTGTCVMKFIDFGFSSEREVLMEHFNEEKFLYNSYSFLRRMVNLGCITVIDINIIKTGEELFNIIAMYDYAIVISYISATYSDRDKLISLITRYQKEIPATSCYTGFSTRD
jgi:tRNA A-37 threonylcarbamoyl transferase component Bud32